MYFSIPVLHEILPNRYLSHFSNFVTGVQILSSKKVTRQDIQRAESYLVSFYSDAGVLYGRLYVLVVTKVNVLLTLCRGVSYYYVCSPCGTPGMLCSVLGATMGVHLLLLRKLKQSSKKTIPWYQGYVIPGNNITLQAGHHTNARICWGGGGGIGG